MTLGYILE